jgi:cytochrome c
VICIFLPFAFRQAQRERKQKPFVLSLSKHEHRTIAAALLFTLMAAPASADPARGERVFQRCHSCHSIVDDGSKLQGPNLRGVIGRRAGALPGFDYSDAMIAAGKNGVVWTRETLDRYIADPEAVVPGSTMAPPPGLNDPAMRADVIDYLEQAGK